MQVAPIPDSDVQRLADPSSYGLRTGQKYPALQGLVEILAEICDAPVAAVSIVDRDGEWYAASVGMDDPGFARSISLCAQAILSADIPLIIEDLRADARFAASQALSGGSNLRSYAGIAIVDASGRSLGALCIMDVRSRRLGARQTRLFMRLRDQVRRQLELLRTATPVLETAPERPENRPEDLATGRDSDPALLRALEPGSFAHQWSARIGRVTAPRIGIAYFEALAEQLIAALEVDYALVGALSRDGDVMDTLVVRSRGGRLANLSYRVQEAPCGKAVLSARPVAYPASVATRFPGCHVLRELRAEAYVGTPLLDVGGRPAGVLAVMARTPMAETGNAETLLQLFAGRAAAELERLQKNEQLKRYQQIVSAAGELLALVDPKLTYVAANDRYCDAFSKTREAIIGSTVPEVLGEETYRQLAAVPLQRCLAGQPQSYESWFSLPGQGLCYLEVNLSPYRQPGSDGVDGVVVVAHDITRRKRAESALLLSEERFRTAFSLAPVGMALVGPQREFLNVNNALCEMLGYSREALLDLTTDAITHPEDQAETIERHGKLFSGVLQSTRNEKRYLHASGRVVWAEVHCTPVPGPHDNVQQIVAQVQDITDRKRALAEKEFERRMLERIAAGASMQDTLEAITVGVERLFPGSACSILHLDRQTGELRHQAAPHLPAGFCAAIDGTVIGEGVGPCGTAAARKCTVIVSNIDTDPLWRDYRVLAARYGFKACYSIPVMASGGEPVGTFATYYRQYREPTPAELNFLERMSHIVGIVMQRSEADERMRRHTQIMDMSEDFMAFVDRNLRYRAVNRRYTEAFGIPEARIIGATPEALFGREVYEKTLRPRQLRALRGESVHERYWVEFPDGPRFIDGSHVPYRDERGQITGFVFSGHDITALKRFEESLRRYAHIVASSSDIMAFLDNQQCVRTVNEACLKAFGKSEAEVVGKRFSELLGFSQYQTLIRSHMERAMAGSAAHTADWFRLPGTGYRFLDVQLRPYRNENDEIGGVIVDGRDVTQLKQAEQSLRQYEKIVSASGDMMLLLDRNGCFLAANDAYLKFYGETRDGIVGKHVSELVGIQAFERDIRPRLRRCLRGEHLRYESDFMVEDRGRQCSDIRYDPFFEGNGQLAGVVVAIRDITEAKQFEARISELERRHLKAEKLAATGRMAARIAHEVNNPLAGIMNALRLIKPSIPQDAPYQEYAAMMDKELDRIARIVKGLYQAYRPETESPQRVDLRETVKQVALMVASTQQDSGIRIVTDLGYAAVSAIIPEDSIRQVLYNLLLNAVHASPHGQEVRIHIVMSGDRVRISVFNRGEIPPHAREHVFEPFFSGGGRGDADGLGLGLAVSKGIIDSLGGDIDFVSDGAGTEFWFEIPVDRIWEDSDGRRTHIDS